MKDLVTTFLKEQGVWVALAVGFGAGAYEFFKTKSFGKALSVLLGGFAFGFIIIGQLWNNRFGFRNCPRRFLYQMRLSYQRLVGA